MGKSDGSSDNNIRLGREQRQHQRKNAPAFSDIDDEGEKHVAKRKKTGISVSENLEEAAAQIKYSKV